MRIISLVPVVLMATLACKSRADKVLNSPSVENAKKLWDEDRAGLKERASALGAQQRDAWADLFEQHLTELFTLAAHDPRTAIDEFCGFLGALVPAPPARDKVTLRLRALCDVSERARDSKDRLARQRSDAEDAVKRAEADLDSALADLKEVQGGGKALYQLSGMMIAALSDRRYEIAQFEARVVRSSYCAPGDDCSGGMALGVSGEHDILETTRTRFERPGRIDPPLCVRSKGEETVKVNGFNQRVTVYQEVDDPDCGAGRVAAANKRVADSRAAVQKARAELQGQPLEILAASDYSTAKGAVLAFLTCAAKNGSKCLDDVAVTHKEEPEVGSGGGNVPTDAPPVPVTEKLDIPSIQALMAAQAASLDGSSSALVDSLADNVIVFLPRRVEPLIGRGEIAGSLAAALASSSPVQSDPATIGLAGDIATIAVVWRIADSSGATVPVRVTGVLENRKGKNVVVAASFSIAPTKADRLLESAISATGSAAGGGADPSQWVTSIPTLAEHVRDDAGTVLIGSDANEYAVGAAAVRSLLKSWSSVQLVPAGSPHIITTPSYMLVAGFARWKHGGTSTLLRVLAAFVPNESAEWQLVSAHYSVALQDRAVPPSTQSKGGPEDALIGKWTGTFEVTMRDPGNPSPSSTKQPISFEVARRDGKLTWLGTDVVSKQYVEKPIVLSASGNGRFVDESNADAETDTYVLRGNRLQVEIKIMGRYGGTAVGTFERQR